MTEFFMPIMPPTVTAQQHKVTTRSGKPVFYDTPEIRNAKDLLMGSMFPFVPEEPYKCAVRLTTKWLFPKGNHCDGAYKATKPDTDNLQKMLKDCMTRMGFWKDDALVASEIIEKFWANTPGIYVRIEELEV